MACTGTPDNCPGQPESTCVLCGCDWDDEFWECDGSPDPCSVHYNQSDCEDCGCDWGVPTNMKINVGDVFREVVEIKINVGGVWKTVTSIKINIGDVWKTVF